MRVEARRGRGTAAENVKLLARTTVITAGMGKASRVRWFDRLSHLKLSLTYVTRIQSAS